MKLIVKIQDRPQLKEIAAQWFHEKWGIPLKAYEDSMEECLKKESPVPQWYLALEGDKIVGGLGLIENDFHNRKDLTPNVCAVYVEADYRGKGIAGRLLNYVCEDCHKAGIDTLYLVTDHTSFYERYGWHFLCMVQGDDEPEMTRMYTYHTLETERLILRPWQEADAEDLYRYASDPKVGPIAGWPVHTSVENSLEIIRGVLSEPETYAVVSKKEGQVIGSIGLKIGSQSSFDLPDTQAEIGYWLGVPFWGQGLIPEAVKEIIRYAFLDLHLEKLWCGYFDGNIKSKRVQEKCGFVYHHTNKDILWPLMGDIRTEHVNCLTRENAIF